MELDTDVPRTFRLHEAWWFSAVKIDFRVWRIVADDNVVLCSERDYTFEELKACACTGWVVGVVEPHHRRS